MITKAERSSAAGSTYRHKKATKWEIPNDEGGSKAADQDEIVKAIQEEADNSEDAEEGEKGSLEQTQGQVSLDTEP